MATSLSDFNNQPISILQNNLTTIHGIFALLRQLNGSYGSRYQIEANPRENFPKESLDQYYEWTDNKKYWSEEGNKTITIQFDSPFLLSGYALSNGVQNIDGSTYPTGWKIYGEINSKFILLDEQKNQQFCGENIIKCRTEHIKGYKIKFQYRAFNKFIFEQTTNSENQDYIFMRSIDLFGTLCGMNYQCNYHFYQLTAQTKSTKCNIIILQSFLFSLS